MTPFPDLPDAEKIAAMRARAKTEAEQYGQTTTPAMLLQGAAWGEEVVRLRAALLGIKRAGQARMATHGDEHSYYYFTASAALMPAAPTEYERKLAQLKEDFPNGI